MFLAHDSVHTLDVWKEWRDTCELQNPDPDLRRNPEQNSYDEFLAQMGIQDRKEALADYLSEGSELRDLVGMDEEDFKETTEDVFKDDGELRTQFAMAVRALQGAPVKSTGNDKIVDISFIVSDETGQIQDNPSERIFCIPKEQIGPSSWGGVDTVKNIIQLYRYTFNKHKEDPSEPSETLFWFCSGTCIPIIKADILFPFFDAGRSLKNEGILFGSVFRCMTPRLMEKILEVADNCLEDISKRFVPQGGNTFKFYKYPFTVWDNYDIVARWIHKSLNLETGYLESLINILKNMRVTGWHIIFSDVNLAQIFNEIGLENSEELSQKIMELINHLNEDNVVYPSNNPDETIINTFVGTSSSTESTNITHPRLRGIGGGLPWYFAQAQKTRIGYEKLKEDGSREKQSGSHADIVLWSQHNSENWILTDVGNRWQKGLSPIAVKGKLDFALKYAIGRSMTFANFQRRVPSAPPHFIGHDPVNNRGVYTQWRKVDRTYVFTPEDMSILKECWSINYLKGDDLIQRYVDFYSRMSRMIGDLYKNNGSYQVFTSHPPQ
jgi:hypothetical protein